MKILIPLDGSKFAETILKPAAKLAASANAEVHLIQVVKPSEAKTTWASSRGVEAHSSSELIVPGLLGGSLSEVAGGVVAETRVQAEERFLREAEDYLDGIAHRFFPHGVEKMVVMEDDPAKEIADYARREKVDLIAIATHGRTGLARLTMGSVAGELLKARVAPLFMIRPDGLYYATSAGDEG